MTTRIQKHGLQVAASLHQMIETEALPGTGVTPDQFWKGLSELVHTLGPKNRALLARRDDGAVWLEKRPASGIWAGLYGLPVFDSVHEAKAKYAR